MDRFDILPFALPGTSPQSQPEGARRDYFFEEPRDFYEIEVADEGNPPGQDPAVFYLQKTWPGNMWYETGEDRVNPVRFGWIPVDDHFNGKWRRASMKWQDTDGGRLGRFEPLSAEGWELDNWKAAARFRRALAIRIEGPSAGVRLFTKSKRTSSVLRVELDAGGKTSSNSIKLEGYNSHVPEVLSAKGARIDGTALTVSEPDAVFLFRLTHMVNSHPYAGDAGLLTIHLDDRAFTIAIDDAKSGIWFAHEAIFITKDPEGPPSLDEYLSGYHGRATIAKKVISRPEQSFGGAFHGQPRPHAVHAHVGVAYCRQRFLVEANGDIVLPKKCVDPIEGAENTGSGFPNSGDGRFFFGFERWIGRGRFRDSSGAPIFNIHSRMGKIVVEEEIFAAPVLRKPGDRQISSEEPVAALVSFRFHNEGAETETAELCMAYSNDSRKSVNGLSGEANQDEYLIPLSEREAISAVGGGIIGYFGGRDVLRCLYTSDMDPVQDAAGQNVRFYKRLPAGESCRIIFKIPFVELAEGKETEELKGLDYTESKKTIIKYWQRVIADGAQISTPVPQLNDLHATHLTHVLLSDFTMPLQPELINTSVGTSVYGNFSNESCMIVQELIQRGRFDDAKRRLDLWIRYQGTVAQPGNFSDYDGMYYGAGGFEQGSYNQHHGWVLWCISEYYHLTGDAEWLKTRGHSLVAACDWIFRQRKHTMGDQQHSRGWEHGFLPAGSLEDVTEFHYWLSTNAVTWRATEHAARALETVEHSEAERIRAESDAFLADLLIGFTLSMESSPLMKLRDGRWVPTIPSRLYLRGRDFGWIREVLEGSVYLLLTGLVDPKSEKGAWILDDYLDNRYHSPPYGYHLRDTETLAAHRGGFSIQPTLLAGLIPHLVRDEPELYIWMFFNAFCACYREEIEGFSEHPMPELGFSNSAQFKTSDEANAVMWMRYLFLYWDHSLLHVGRAVPRGWLGIPGRWGVTGVRTYHGTVDAIYTVGPDGPARLQIDFSEEKSPGDFVARFRHPKGAQLQRVEVNGSSWDRFDVEKNDVDISGVASPIDIQVTFRPD